MSNERNNLEEEYKNLFPDYASFSETQQWKKEGDTIEEFNLYEDYPPAYSSCHTEVLGSY